MKTETTGDEGTIKILEQEYQQAVQAPCHDGLTNLFNHGFFLLSLDRELARSRRYGTPFVVVFFDINNFSAFNRDHGMLAGDLALKRIARLIIEQGLRKTTDLAARIAGDRFALLLLETTLPQAKENIGRLLHILHKEFAKDLSLCAGLTSFPGESESASRDVLLQRAEEALMRAKNSTIDNICCYDDSGPSRTDSPGTILLVDDEPRNVKLLEALLTTRNYDTVSATSGEDALRIVARCDIDLILLDIMMPAMDGYEVCRRLKSSEATRMIPIIMVTALDDIEAKIKGIEVGADDFLTKPPSKIELLTRTRSLLKTKRLNEKLTSIETVLSSLANVVEAKDPYTQGHVCRVAQLAQECGRKLGLSAEEIESLKIGGILHDIGKIAIPKDILNKSGQLTAGEWDLMMTHSSIGHKICLPLKKNLGLALQIIRHHHEKLDGSGYPDELQGEEIPVVVRIMAVVDIYDAMITDRPYRKALSREKALLILREEAASGKIDKNVVEVLVQMTDRQDDGEELYDESTDC